MEVPECSHCPRPIDRSRNTAGRSPLLPVVLSAAFLFAGCGNSGDPDEAGAQDAGPAAASLYLKDLPSLEKAFQEEATRIRDRMEAGTATMDQYRAVVAEWGPRIAEYFDATPMDPIPVTALGGRPYRLSDARPVRLGAATNVAGGMRLNTQVTLTLEQDVSGSAESLDWLEFRTGSSRGVVTIYFKAVDVNGRDIPGLKREATERATPSQLAAGGTIDLGIGWSSSEVASMQAIGGIVEITRAEHDIDR